MPLASPARRDLAARVALLVALASSALVLGGCAAGSWTSLVPVVFYAASLALAGCALTHGGGTSSPCCETGADGIGHVTTCECPAGWACNYAPYTVCADGTCVYDYGTTVCEGADAGTDAAVLAEDAGTPTPDAPSVEPDAGGYWEACCETGTDGIGHVSTCFCPAGWACNYGLFTDCGGGICAYGDCPDAGSSSSADAGAGTGAP